MPNYEFKFKKTLLYLLRAAVAPSISMASIFIVLELPNFMLREHQISWFFSIFCSLYIFIIFNLASWRLGNWAEEQEKILPPP